MKSTHLRTIGLAIAFGIGAAVFAGHGMASAAPDDSGAPPHSVSDRASKKSPASSKRKDTVRAESADIGSRTVTMRVRTDSDDTAKTPKKPARQNDSPVTLATLAVAARREAQPSPPLARAVHSITTLADLAPTPPLAPQGLIVRLPSTRMLFPAVNQLKETGHNTLATGTPVASRMVIYNNTVDDNKRVTYAVDVYADAGAAHVAYWDAVKLSLQAGGFSPLTDPRIGNESFAGTSAGEGGQKHIGVGVRIGNIVIGATHAGYDTDPATIRKIVYLARVQAFKAAVMAPFYNIFGWP